MVLLNSVVEVVRSELMRTQAAVAPPVVQFAWPDGLQVSDDGRMLRDLPESWLASAMPDPYSLDNANPLTLDRVAPQLVTLATVLLMAVWMVHGLIKPINRIAAANAFSHAIAPDPIPETGTAELRRTARAFNAMQARIQGYMLDRERLFVGISHSLKTPIMRLKLRTELLDDDVMRSEFHEDLDDLDVMVKSALQSLRETDVHENLVVVRLDTLLERLVARPIHLNAVLSFQPQPISIQCKPMALQRAIGNLLDNAVLYGDRVQVCMERIDDMVILEIRDFGPGLPEPSLHAAFEPHVRLGHGHARNRNRSGLGLGIARHIIQAQGGKSACTTTWKADWWSRYCYRPWPIKRTDPLRA